MKPSSPHETGVLLPLFSSWVESQWEVKWFAWGHRESNLGRQEDRLPALPTLDAFTETFPQRLHCSLHWPSVFAGGTRARMCSVVLVHMPDSQGWQRCCCPAVAGLGWARWKAVGWAPWWTCSNSARPWCVCWTSGVLASSAFSCPLSRGQTGRTGALFCGFLFLLTHLCLLKIKASSCPSVPPFFTWLTLGKTPSLPGLISKIPYILIGPHEIAEFC